MTLKEYRMSQKGLCVADWGLCSRSLHGTFRIVKNKFEMFVDEHTLYRTWSTCTFYKGNSPSSPPRIAIEFWHEEKWTTFRDAERSLILTFMHRMTGWSGNLTFNQRRSEFCLAFEITLKHYAPFCAKQLEIDLFSPFGGNGSQPDVNRGLPGRYSHSSKWWEVSYCPITQHQRLLGIGPFCCCNTVLPKAFCRDDEDKGLLVVVEAWEFRVPIQLALSLEV